MNRRPGGLLLCTDMDRTVIPNGYQPEHPAARECFRRLCALPHICLVYVTGRHQALVKQAIAEFGLPVPAYVITDVGTRIYHIDSGQWRELPEWQDHIAKYWHGKTHAELSELLADIHGLKLQEANKQSRHKLSYYLELVPDCEQVLQQVRGRLQEAGVEASVVWSIDEIHSIGLIDVLPLHATKLEAIEFLQHKLGYSDESTIFAGDSGNDMEVLVSHIPSVLVGNATDEVRQIAQQTVLQNGNAAWLYQARDEPEGMPGNYCAGVLQGVMHFIPELRELVEQGLRNDA